ncbi:MAG TPA: hypothetical protein VE175_02495 [Woeseiaceae bacterium]|nr:hypothetical protein [Woeseiaceae bacterium]
MDAPTPGRKSPPFDRLERTALGGCLMWLMALAGTASAAPCVPGDHRMQDRQIPELTAAPMLPGLMFRAVDLGETQDIEAPEGGLTESMAPVLFLAPRVTSILEEVFGDSEAGGSLVKHPTVADEDTDAAPSLGDAEAEDDPARYGPLSQADNAVHVPKYELPKYQRQMYRTDI